MSGVEVTADSAERNAPPAAVVIFGASGDLTRRKLVPAIESLARAKRLPAEFAVVGVARTPMGDEEFRRLVLGGNGSSVRPELTERLPLPVRRRTTTRRPTAASATCSTELDAERGTAGTRLFYLATPPEAFPHDRQRAGRGRAEPPG